MRFPPSFRLHSVASVVCGTENHWRCTAAEWLSPCWPSSAISWEGNLSFRSGWQRRERELCGRMMRWQPPRAPWHLALHPGRRQQAERRQRQLEQHLGRRWQGLLRIRPTLRPVESRKSTRLSSLRYVKKLQINFSYCHFASSWFGFFLFFLPFIAFFCFMHSFAFV